MIHVFERAGVRLALDVASGAVHVLDEVAYAILRAAPGAGLEDFDGPALEAVKAEHGPAAVEDTLKELRALQAEGLLYSEDDYSGFADALGEAPVKAMCLHIAHDCNLRCRYCFASTGGFGGQRKLMPPEVAKGAIDLLVSLSEGRRNLEVDFFGGEPLMNFEVVRQTVDYARAIEREKGKNFRFTLTTNGLGLTDEIAKYINDEMSNVVLSIDGRKEVNDEMRPTAGGQGSFDTIVPRCQKLVENRGEKEYYVRGTYTRHNLDFDRDVLALYDLGFDQISVEPVVGPEADSYTIAEAHLPAIEESYERLLAEMAGRRKQGRGDFNFFHFMLDLDNGPCAIKRLKGCGSGNEYVAVTPDGEIYPCHQFVGHPEFLMGSIEEGITNTGLKQSFARANLLNKPECQSCWAKYFCSGGCNANNHFYANSVLSPHGLSCQIEKMRLECAIALKALEMQ